MAKKWATARNSATGQYFCGRASRRCAAAAGGRQSRWHRVMDVPLARARFSPLKITLSFPTNKAHCKCELFEILERALPTITGRSVIAADAPVILSLPLPRSLFSVRPFISLSLSLFSAKICIESIQLRSFFSHPSLLPFCHFFSFSLYISVRAGAEYIYKGRGRKSWTASSRNRGYGFSNHDESIGRIFCSLARPATAICLCMWLRVMEPMDWEIG